MTQTLPLPFSLGGLRFAKCEPGAQHTLRHNPSLPSNVSVAHHDAAHARNQLPSAAVVRATPAYRSHPPRPTPRRHHHVCAPRKPPIRLDPDALRARINRQHAMTRALTPTHSLPSPSPLRHSRQKAPRRSHPAWETRPRRDETPLPPSRVPLLPPRVFACATPRAAQ